MWHTDYTYNQVPVLANCLMIIQSLSGFFRPVTPATMFNSAHVWAWEQKQQCKSVCVTTFEMVQGEDQ